MALRDRAEQADASLALCSCKGSACAERNLSALRICRGDFTSPSFFRPSAAATAFIPSAPTLSGSDARFLRSGWVCEAIRKDSDPAGRDLLCFAARTFVEANYVTANSTGNSRSSWWQVRLVQWTIACLVIGLIYKPVF